LVWGCFFHAGLEALLHSPSFHAGLEGPLHRFYLGSWALRWLESSGPGCFPQLYFL
jgi:hypothetical protein